MSWIELNQIELDWIKLKRIELNQIEFKWIGFSWIKVIQLNSIGSLQIKMKMDSNWIKSNELIFQWIELIFLGCHPTWCMRAVCQGWADFLTCGRQWVEGIWCSVSEEQQQLDGVFQWHSPSFEKKLQLSSVTKECDGVENHVVLRRQRDSWLHTAVPARFQWYMGLWKSHRPPSEASQAFSPKPHYAPEPACP